MGVDPICRQPKVCNFKCAYCRLGYGGIMITERSRFVDEKQVVEEAREFLEHENVDTIKIRGTGEPFLASNLHQITVKLRCLTDCPIAVLTNASMLCQTDVMSELDDYDIAIVKLDAANEKGFNDINRPHKSVKWDKTISSLRLAVRESKADIRVQVMIVKNNLDQVEAIAMLCNDIGIEMVYLSTPTKGDLNELSKKELLEQTKFFKNFKVKTIFDNV
jgi:wyosine [tRNA(Phe)-imidazoG37] synthetase (radical SAM superfamily)